MKVVSLLERPDLFDAAFGIDYAPGDGSEFMQGNMAAILVRAARAVRIWPQHILAAIDDDERVVARAVSVPFCAAQADRDSFPDGGWDQIAIWAVEDALDGTVPDTVCALEIAVDPMLRGRGLSVAMLEALRDSVDRAGFQRFIAPARPPGKSERPNESIDDYLLGRRDDGSHADWWLRLHERVGGRIAGIARCSGTVQADLATWRRWTGLAFDVDAPTVVPGGLVPVLVSVEHDLGVYVEPNIWIDHST